MEQDYQLTLSEIIKDSGKYVPSHLIPGICGLASLTLFTHLLNPVDYASYILILTTVTFVANIGFGWLNFSALRFFDEAKADLGPFLSTSATSCLLLLSAIVIFGYSLLCILKQLGFMPANNVPFILVALLLALKIVFDQLLIFMRATRLALKFSLFRTIDAIMKLGLAVLFIISLGLTYAGVVWGMIASLFTLSCYEIIQTRLYRLIRLRLFSREILGHMFHYGFPLIGAGVTGTVLSLADRYMLAYFCDYTTVGLYSAGYRFAEMCVDIPGAILLMAYTPILIQKFNKHRGIGFEEVMAQPLKLVSVLLIPITVGAIFLSKDFVRLFLGQSFRQVHVVFPWVCSGVFFSCVNQVYTRIFELKKVTKFVLMISGMAALTNILLNILLIPKFGYVGAAVATAIAYFVQLAASFKYSQAHIALTLPLYTVFGALIASSIMCVGIYGLSRVLAGPDWFTLACKIMAGGFLYVSTLLMLKEPTARALLRFSPR